MAKPPSANSTSSRNLISGSLTCRLSVPKNQGATYGSAQLTAIVTTPNTASQTL